MPLIDRSGVAGVLEDLLQAEIDAIPGSSDTHEKIKSRPGTCQDQKSNPHTSLSVIVASSRRAKTKMLVVTKQPKQRSQNQRFPNILHKKQKKPDYGALSAICLTPFRKIPTAEKRMSHSTSCK